VKAGPKLIQEMEEKVIQIRQWLKEAQDRKVMLMHKGLTSCRSHDLFVALKFERELDMSPIISYYQPTHDPSHFIKHMMFFMYIFYGIVLLTNLTN
jgi:hypothetical protein